MEEEHLEPFVEGLDCLNEDNDHCVSYMVPSINQVVALEVLDHFISTRNSASTSVCFTKNSSLMSCIKTNREGTLKFIATNFDIVFLAEDGLLRSHEAIPQVPSKSYVDTLYAFLTELRINHKVNTYPRWSLLLSLRTSWFETRYSVS